MNRELLMFCAIVAMTIIPMATAQASVQRGNPTTVEMVVYDLFGEPYRPGGAPWGAHEGIPHGVPADYDWCAGAHGFSNYGRNQAITTWGHVYEWAAGSPEKNVRIHVRNMRTYAFRHGEWQLIEDPSIGGAYFSEDYRSSRSFGDNVRLELDGGIGISFPMVDGYNFHWWSSIYPRQPIPKDAEAFYTSVEIRLIPNTNPSVNLGNAKYLASVSWDWYPTRYAAGPGPWPSVGLARFRFVKPEWQTLTMYVPGTFKTPESAAAFRDEIASRPLPPGVSPS